MLYQLLRNSSNMALPLRLKLGELHSLHCATCYCILMSYISSVTKICLAVLPNFSMDKLYLSTWIVYYILTQFILLVRMNTAATNSVYRINVNVKLMSKHKNLLQFPFLTNMWNINSVEVCKWESDCSIQNKRLTKKKEHRLVSAKYQFFNCWSFKRAN